MQRKDKKKPGIYKGNLRQISTCYEGNILFFLGQCEYELQSSSLPVFGRDGSSVYQNGVFHNGQSEAGSAQLARTAFVYPVEAFEQAVQVFRSYAYPCICKAEIIEVLVFAETADVYIYVGTSVGDGVVHQIPEDGVE